MVLRRKNLFKPQKLKTMKKFTTVVMRCDNAIRKFFKQLFSKDNWPDAGGGTAAHNFMYPFMM
jgi:hypothetical protein